MDTVKHPLEPWHDLAEGMPTDRKQKITLKLIG
jgi:hypothetical protein